MGLASTCVFKDYGAVNMGIRHLMKRSSHKKEVRERFDKLDKKFNVQTYSQCLVFN
jgi:hypothetical protein